MVPPSHPAHRRGGAKAGVRLRLLPGILSIVLAVAPHPAAAQAQGRLPILDVPFISQSQALCGGAAAAMVLRYWGERGLTAESFAHLVDYSAAGIRTDALIGELRRRGWDAAGIRGEQALIERELARGRPVIALIEDRPGAFHYVVVVAAYPRAIVLHDPARTPFRVMTHSEFARRWNAAARWMAVVVPAATPDADRAATATVDAPREVVTTQCDQLVADGVRYAQVGDFPAAERALSAALSCPGPAAPRELAGVRLLQRRWPEAAALASAAVAEDAHDAHAWRLLATSRFVLDDPAGALAAWNAAGEPRVDFVRIDGLTRTRQRIVERLIGVEAGEVLTPGRLIRARRRLGELPSALSTRLGYVPVPGGLAEVDAAVAERPVMPSDVWGYAAIGMSAAARRELELSTGALSGGGERMSFAWRFWAGRPRLGVYAQSPAPWGGLWGLAASAERQPFDTESLDPARRRTARATVSNWATSRTRWTMSGGIDRWASSHTLGVIGGALRYASHDDRVDARLETDQWIGPEPFRHVSGVLLIQSSAVRQGAVLHLSGGVGALSGSAPADLWFGGDTGHARAVLLRAHPLLDAGRLRTAQLGRTVMHGSVEGRHWWHGPAATRIGAALFIDSARVDRRFDAGSRGDVDVGLGARLTVPGLTGVFRADVARGLRDGATALSFVYEP